MTEDEIMGKIKVLQKEVSTCNDNTRNRKIRQELRDLWGKIREDE